MTLSTDRRAVPPGEFYLSDSVADLLGRLAAEQLAAPHQRLVELSDRDELHALIGLDYTEFLHNKSTLAARQLLELRIRGARLADVLSRGEIIVDALQSVHLVGQDQRLRSSRTSAMCLATRS